MSNTGTDGEITVAAGDVTVTKTYEPDRFPVPAMAFGVRSDRGDATTVRIVEDVPEAVPTDDLGFHPEYGSQHWSIEGEQAVFEREFDAGEEYLTVYGIRNVEPDRIEQFMTEPTLEAAGESTARNDSARATTPGGADDARAGSDREASGPQEPDREGGEALDTDTTAASTGTTPDTDADASQPGGAAAPTDDAASPDDRPGPGATGTGAGTAGTTGATGTEAEGAQSGAGSAEAGSAGASAGAGAAGAGSAGAEPDRDGTVAEDRGVAAALAEELRAGEIAAEDREVLADELSQMDRDADVRIKHLQSEVSDLAAYSDALGEFIEENGPARELLDDLTERIGDLEAEVSDHDTRIEDAEGDLAAVEERAGTNESDIEGLDERASDHDAGIADLDERAEANTADLDALDDRLTEAEERIEALDTGLSDLGEETDTAHEEINALREEIEGIQEWRSQISEVLGGVDDDA